MAGAVCVGDADARVRGWPEFAPPVALSAGPLGRVQAADREIGRLTALRARAVADFAAERPASVDRPQGAPGAMSPERWAGRHEVLRPVSEWATQELALASSITAEAAEALLTRSLTLVHRLPGTLAALEAGALHPGHLWPLLDHVAPVDDDGIRAEVEAGLLRWAAGRVTTPAQLGAKARREVARRDARAEARKLASALRDRGVHWRPDRVEGMGTVTALLTLPESRALIAALGAYADAAEDEPGDPPRTRAQKMADCLMDLVLRPDEADLPPVQVMLSVIAPVATALGGDEPGEIDGHPVPAEMIRGLLHALAGHEPAGHGPATAAPARQEGARPGPAPGPLHPDCPAWAELVQAELRSWAEETERRILADGLDDPDPMTPEVFDVWLAMATPPWDDVDPPPIAGDQPSDDPASDDPGLSHAPAAPASGPLHPSAYIREVGSDPPTDATGVGGDWWWGDADRAVHEAGEAVRHAELTMARARRFVRTADACDRADEAEWAAGPSGRVDAAENAIDALAASSDDQRAALAGLLDRSGGGGLAERPRIVVVDAVTGALRALTDLPGLRRAAHCGAPACRRRPDTCHHDLTDRPALGPPGPTDGYRPAAALDRWVRARDRRCRFPGCRRRVPACGELDHDRPYPDGPTGTTNLTGYCTGHHRGKHQAPGWRHHLHPDGTLTVATPTGLVAVTTPPPY